MARKLRLEYPGAIYHVINRGNYRAWMFKTEGARAAFETCLFEGRAEGVMLYLLPLRVPDANVLAPLCQ